MFHHDSQVFHYTSRGPKTFLWAGKRLEINPNKRELQKHKESFKNVLG